MAVNIAARRAAKANRRKAIVAQKRKMEVAGGSSIASQVASAASSPIRYCLCTESLFDTGSGSVLLARGGSFGTVVTAGFLVDPFCYGIKDVLLRGLDADQLEFYVDAMNEAAPMAPLEPADARKLLRDLAAWSTALGFPPPREFAAAERLFGDIEPSTAQFTFGKDGKPLYVADASHEAKRHIERLTKQLGSDGFDYLVGAI